MKDQKFDSMEKEIVKDLWRWWLQSRGIVYIENVDWYTAFIKEEA